MFHSFKTSSSSSVTRRSAGMPIILQAIVTVERKYKQVFYDYVKKIKTGVNNFTIINKTINHEILRWKSRPFLETGTNMLLNFFKRFIQSNKCIDQIQSYEVHEWYYVNLRCNLFDYIKAIFCKNHSPLILLIKTLIKQHVMFQFIFCLIGAV